MSYNAFVLTKDIFPHPASEKEMRAGDDRSWFYVTNVKVKTQEKTPVF
jgi:hypothetical protein